MGQSELNTPDIDVQSLAVNQPLPQDIYDVEGLLLLRSGVVITRAFIEKLQQRGIKKVRHAAGVTAEESQSRPRDGGSLLAPLSAPESAPDGPAADHPDLVYTNVDVPCLSIDAFFERLPHAEKAYNKALENYARMVPELLDGTLENADMAYHLIEDFSGFLNDDPVLLAMLVRVRSTQDPHRYRHSLKTSLLTLVLAQRMGFDPAAQSDAGVAALLHDLGMAKVSPPVHDQPRELTAGELRTMAEHPDRTLEILNGLRGISDAVKHAVYQVHERRDGQGYPRGRKPTFVSPAAKIIAVADAYAALTAPRPWRPAYSGHDAMKILLADTKTGKFDKSAMRALLDALSLFPVGTRISLSDGRDAQVLRGVPGANTKPIVVALKMDGTPGRREIDLSQPDQPSITAIHPEPELGDEPADA
ncbi:MAG: HD domain-containing phosphohydrolase [Algisphaera sp.]